MVTIKTLSRRSGYDQSTIYAWIASGRLPAKKISKPGMRGRGFKYMVKLDTFNTFLKENKIGKPRPHRQYVRDLSTYKQFLKHPNHFKEDTSPTPEVVAAEEASTPVAKVEKHIKEASEKVTIKTKAATILEEYLKSVYDSYELTPQEFHVIKKAYKILKGEK